MGYPSFRQTPMSKSPRSSPSSPFSRCLMHLSTSVAAWIATRTFHNRRKDHLRLDEKITVVLSKKNRMEKIHRLTQEVNVIQNGVGVCVDVLHDSRIKKKHYVEPTFHSDRKRSQDTRLSVHLSSSYHWQRLLPKKWK